MHNAALRAMGLAGWRYQLLPVPSELFAQTVTALPQAGFRGANVTIPHKEAALRLADSPSDRARAIGAANTLIFEETGEIRAENTDAPALIAALPFPAQDKTALVLGAGGSARAAVWALLDAGAAEVMIWNRTPARATALAADLGARPTQRGEPANFLVNCTSIGLDDPDETFKHLPVPADCLNSYDCVVDLVYRATETRLASAARARLVPVVEGIEILVGQGALSFELFTGARAPVKVMRAAVQPQ